VVAGGNNWVPASASNVPTEWTGTLSGTDPGFVDIAALDLRPAESGALHDAGASSPSGPVGQPFPSPLALPGFHPPMRALEAPGGARARGADGPIDIGAYESIGATGVPDAGAGGTPGKGGSGGASGSGGTFATGGASGSGGTSSASGGAGESGGASGSAGAPSGGSGTGGRGGGMSGALSLDSGMTEGSDAGVMGSGASDDGGCGCRMSGRRSGALASVLALLAVVSVVRRRRR
jgi:hypothetical protein